jgi:hypothetical protein
MPPPPSFPSKYLNRWANLALRDIVSEQKVFPAAPPLLLLVLTARQINILFPIVLYPPAGRYGEGRGPRRYDMNGISNAGR